jgi:hypothetical protein
VLLTRLDAHPDWQGNSRPPGGVRPSHRLANLDGSSHSAQRIILVSSGGAEDADDHVADDMLHGCAVPDENPGRHVASAADTSRAGAVRSPAIYDAALARRSAATNCIRERSRRGVKRTRTEPKCADPAPTAATFLACRAGARVDLPLTQFHVGAHVVVAGQHRATTYTPGWRLVSRKTSPRFALAGGVTAIDHVR